MVKNTKTTKKTIKKEPSTIAKTPSYTVNYAAANDANGVFIEFAEAKLENEIPFISEEVDAIMNATAALAIESTTRALNKQFFDYILPASLKANRELVEKEMKEKNQGTFGKVKDKITRIFSKNK